MRKVLLVIFIFVAISCRPTPEKGYHNCEIILKKGDTIPGWNPRCGLQNTSFEDTIGKTIRISNGEIHSIYVYLNPRKNEK